MTRPNFKLTIKNDIVYIFYNINTFICDSNKSNPEYVHKLEFSISNRFSQLLAQGSVKYGLMVKHSLLPAFVCPTRERMVCISVNVLGGKQIKRIILLCNTWKLHEIRISVFINKILLETVMPIHLNVVFGCFCGPKVRLTSWNRNYMAHRAQNIHFLTLFRKCVPTPVAAIVRDSQNMSLRSIGQQQDQKGCNYWEEICSDGQIWSWK